MPAVREPNLPVASAAALVDLITILDESLRPFVPSTERDPRLQRGVEFLQPREQFALASDLARELSAYTRSLLNGAKVRDGSEQSGWRGRASEGGEQEIAERVSGGNPRLAAVARTALAHYAQLNSRGAFGLVRMSREAFVRAALAGADAEFDSASGTPTPKRVAFRAAPRVVGR